MTLHMTGTEQNPNGEYHWYCRCGEGAGGFTDQNAARLAGDAHLATANRERSNGHDLCRNSWDGELATYSDIDSVTMCRTCQKPVERPTVEAVEESVDRRITPTGHATPRDLWPDAREAAADDQ